MSHYCNGTSIETMITINRFLRVPIVALMLALSACVSITAGGHYQINAVVIRNSSETGIEQAQIKVEKTQELFSCGHIIKGTECSTTFRVRDYAGNAISVSWVQDGKLHITGLFIMEIPSKMKADIPMTAVLEIRDRGRTYSYLTQ